MSTATARKLTPKQQLFIEEYLVDLNATQAAIRSGYSSATAKEIGCENLAKLNAEISEAKASRMGRIRITADDILVHLTSAVRAQISEIRNDDGTFKPVSEWPAIWQQLSSGGDVDIEDLSERSHDNVQAGDSKSWDKVGTITKIRHRFVDRGKLIELAMRHTQVNAMAAQKVEETHHVHLHFADRVSDIRRVLAEHNQKQLSEQPAIDAELTDNG